MKKLLLIRHAKAVSELGNSDFERPLKNSGIRDAELMAERLHHAKIVPQMLVSSPAIRTLSTANIFSEYLSLPKAKEDLKIYEASRLVLLNLISEFDDKHNFIGLIGHNPTMEQIAHYLTGELIDFPTCAIALVEFNVDKWAEVSADTGTLKWYSSPKED
jgi:phosphohistidine phosphatase